MILLASALSARTDPRIARRSTYMGNLSLCRAFRRDSRGFTVLSLLFFPEFL